MKLYTLDAIVRNTLIKRGYPLHYYIQFLVYGKDILRELSLHHVQVVNTKRIPLDAENEIQLPEDYADFVEVGVPVGQKVRPLVRDTNLNRLPNYDTQFNITEYTQSNQSNPPIIYNYLFPLYWNTVTYNQYGENIGRLYGWGAGNPSDTFNVIPERNVIKINEQLSVDNIVLTYISDGTSSDAATRITPYAFDSIEKGIIWQYKENTRIYSEGERARAKSLFTNAVQILRASDSITIEEIKRIAQEAYSQASRY